MFGEEDLKNSKSKRIFWVVLLLVDLAILGIFFYVLYAGEDYSVNQKENSYLIGASYMTMNNEFYKIMSEEISARVEAEGDRMILRDPALDADRQVEQITEMLEMGIDALVVTPVEPESLTPVLEKAKEQGVLIIIVDTNVYNENLAECAITSDNYNAGLIVGEYFLQQHDEARLVIMTHEHTRSGQDRVHGFLDAIDGHNDIVVVQQIECEGQLEIAMPRLQEAIDAGVEFDSVFCLNDLASVGVVAALEENNLLDTVDVYGVDASPDAKVLIKEGMMGASAAQFPSQIGREAADAVYNLLGGKTVEKSILVSVELITQDNVEEFGTDRWQ